MAETADIAVIDGEAAGETPWEFTALLEQGLCTYSLDAAAAIHGTGGYKLLFDGNNKYTYAYRSIAAQTEVYRRVYWKIPAFSATNGAWYRMYPVHSGGSDLVQLFLTYHTAGGGSFGYLLTTRDNSGVQAVIDKSANAVFLKDTEYFLDFHWKQGAGNGGCQFWINGVSEASNFTYTNTTYTAARINSGITAGSANPAVGSVMYFDDLLVSTTGPIGEYDPGVIPLTAGVDFPPFLFWSR